MAEHESKKITCLGVKSCEHQTLSQILTPGSPVKPSGRQVPDQVSRPALSRITTGWTRLQGSKQKNGNKETYGVYGTTSEMQTLDV